VDGIKSTAKDEEEYKNKMLRLYAQHAEAKLTDIDVPIVFSALNIIYFLPLATNQSACSRFL